MTFHKNSNSNQLDSQDKSTELQFNGALLATDVNNV